MSFQEKGFGIPKGSENVNDGDTLFDNLSRMEPKHGRAWFLDAAEAELSPCKKRAMEAPISKPESGINMSNSLLLENSPTFESVQNQYMDWLYGYETRLANLVERNKPLAAESELFPTKKQAVGASVCKIASRIDVSNSLLRENSSTFQSVKNQYMDWLFGSKARLADLTERHMPVVWTDGPHVKEKVTDELENDSLISLSISDATEEPASGFSYGGTREVKVNQAKGPENGLDTSLEQSYGKEGGNVKLMGHSYSIGDANVKSMDGWSFGKGINFKGNSNGIFFGTYKDVMDALASPVSSYSLLYEQPSVQRSDKRAVDPLVSASPLPKSQLESTYKNKLEKNPDWRLAPNSFPSNVKSLTVTGMLDGAPVQYISASQEKELPGIIKGAGYLCGCQSCNYYKVVNAYEFEHHAGCKTSHPNNHIHFENGKSIHQIVQELKRTPQSMLFDAIQSVTGSPINQKAFCAWKESFQAATRGLQRI